MVLNSVASAGRSAAAQAISSAIHHFAELHQDSPFVIIAFGSGHVHVHVCVCGGGGSVFCLMYVLPMRLTFSLSPPLPRGMNGALCSPPQYDLFNSLNKSNARYAFVCFLVLEILSATNVQQRDRSELKISGHHACAPMADVDFGARVNWLSTDVAFPLVAIIAAKTSSFQALASTTDDRF